MRSLWRDLFFGVAWFAAAASYADATGDCRPIKMAELHAMATQKGDLDVVFFASWCASCADNLQAKTDRPTVYVAAFDEHKSAVAVAAKYGILSACYFDADVTEKLGIKALPAKTTIKSKAPEAR